MRYGIASALVSIGYRYTLVQSPTSMNVSGPWVSSAIRQHFEDNMLSQEEGAVLLVHDDLELDLGVVKVRKWDSSHKGHNGVKSVQASPSKFVQGSAAKTARLCVGIGRPEGRDKRTVSDFVLSRIPKYDRSVLEGKATQKVFEALSELERKW
jgi:PTH1 family peptidyl-tRNA hydrolase